MTPREHPQRLPPILVVSKGGDAELARIRETARIATPVGSCAELRAHLEAQADAVRGVRNLDLIDHRGSEGAVMELGTWRIDFHDEAPSEELEALAHDRI